jgi:signal transduction histidine kinase
MSDPHHLSTGAPHASLPLRLLASARRGLAVLLDAEPSRVSLRRQLLRNLVLPLCTLAFGSAFFAYWLCWQYIERQTDRSLSSYATSLAEQARISGADSALVLPPLARAMLEESSSSRDLVYRIHFPDGRENGLADLALRPGEDMDPILVDGAELFDADVDGAGYRVAQIAVPGSEGPVVIDVGSPLNRAGAFAEQFLFAVMLPAGLLLLAAVSISWRVVNRQIRPLSALADALNRQTHRSLEPVDEALAPEEIEPLVAALNGLIIRLSRASDAQRRFIADAAHQLRTPLTAIKLHAERAAGARDPEAARQAILEVRDASARAARLSNQLLSLARAEPGGAPAKRHPFDLAQLFFDLGAEWAPRALAQSVDFGFEVDIPGYDGPDAPTLSLPCLGDETLAREALSNLVDNALKHSRPAADAAVSLRLLHLPPGELPEWVASRIPAEDLSDGSPAPALPTPEPSPHGWAVAVVEDNGSGVPEHARRKLFRRFFRADTADEGGSGLGLAIAQEIARVHQGSLGYEPNPNGGARFCFFLPLREDLADPSAAPRPALDIPLVDD